MTPVGKRVVLQEPRRRAVEATLQLLTGYEREYNLSSTDLLSYLIEDLQIELHRPASPPSTSALSAASQASKPHFSLVLKHGCKNQWVCPKYCDLCASNPDKRCETESDLAPKQLEEKDTLKTRCGAALQATVYRHEAFQGEQPDGAFALHGFNPQDFCIEMSMVSAQAVASLTEAEANLTVEAIRQGCELLTKKDKADLLLRKGANSQENSDNQRVRADFLPGRDHVSLDVRVTENSQRRLAANQKFQLLVVLTRKIDCQPVAYTLSNAFQVTTNRSQVDWNAETPCWNFSVNKLDKCGTEITKNLLNVRECAESKGFVPPPHQCINVVKTVQDFCILHKDMESWGSVPRDVVNALTPEKAVKHAKKMLTRDCRMRVYMPKDSQHGAMYLCHQAQVNLADSNTGVLLSSNFIRETMRIFLPEHRSADENARLSDVARQADMAWRQPGHPDWYAAREDQDGEALLDDFRQLDNVRGLEVRTQDLANMLHLDARIFQPTMMHTGGPLPAPPQGAGHWGPPPVQQQQPPQVAAGHSAKQQSAYGVDSNSDFRPRQNPQPLQSSNPPVLQAWPGSSESGGYMLTGDRIFAEPEAGQISGNSVAMAPDIFDLPAHVTAQPPSSSDNLLPPQAQTVGYDPADPTQAPMPSPFPASNAAGPNIPPQGAPPVNSQDISSHTRSISPNDTSFTASTSAHLGTVSPTDSHLWWPRGSGHTQHSTGSGAVQLLLLQQQQQHQQQQHQQQQQQLYSSMTQDLQPPGQVSLNPGQLPFAPGPVPLGPEQSAGAGTYGFGSGLDAIVLSGYPTHHDGGREFGHSQSERVRRKPPSRTPSFGNCRDAKRRSTAPPSMLDDAIEDICSADPLGQSLQSSAHEACHPGSGAIVASPHQPIYWPMGSSSSQDQPRWTADATPSGIQFTLPGLSSLLMQNRVQRPVQQHTWVLDDVPQSDGAGDQSSEDISFLDKDGVMNLLATGGLGDEANSQQQADGQDQNGVEEIQPNVPYVVFVFLAKMRALVVRRRRHQLGAVAESLALDSCRKRMLERAVIARFAKSGRASSIEGARAPSLDLSDLYNESGCDLWDEPGHQNDDRHLLDMAAEYFC